MNYIHEKFCPSCQEWLPVKEFPRFRDSKTVCLSCQRNLSRRHNGTHQSAPRDASVKSQTVTKSPPGPNRSERQKPDVE